MCAVAGEDRSPAVSFILSRCRSQGWAMCWTGHLPFLPEGSVE